MTALQLERRPDGWWITGQPDTEPDCGPYGTKAEADSDRVGLARFYRHGHRRDFVTCDPEPPASAAKRQRLLFI